MIMFSWHVNTYFGPLSSITSSKKRMQKHVFLYLCKNDRFVIIIENMNISSIISQHFSIEILNHKLDHFLAFWNWLDIMILGVCLSCALSKNFIVCFVDKHAVTDMYKDVYNRYVGDVYLMFFTGCYRSNCTRGFDRQSDS